MLILMWRICVPPLALKGSSACIVLPAQHFRLKQKGVAEPLVHIKKAFRISKDGTRVYVDLLQGRISNADQGHAKVECWTFDHERDSAKRHDWKCRISVSRGGLLESTNDFDFVAPTAEYRPTELIEMPKTLEKEWKSEARRGFYVKLGTGTYGRMSFTMIAGGDHFFEIESFVNPTGSRNLEFDLGVQPKQTQFE